MLLKISRLNKFGKYYWECKPLKISMLGKFSKKNVSFIYKNEDFYDILNLVLNNMSYDYIKLTIWSFQTDLLDTIEYTCLANEKRFATLILDKANSIKLMNPKIYDDLRLCNIHIYCDHEQFFRFTSDNYGEHTSITIKKVIDEQKLFQLLDDIFSTNL